MATRSCSSTETASASALILLADGDAVHVEGDHRTAAELYTSCLTSLDRQPEQPIGTNNDDEEHVGEGPVVMEFRRSRLGVRFAALSHRAAAHLKLDEYRSALDDARAALSLLSGDDGGNDVSAAGGGSALAIESCHWTLGMAAFHLGMHAEALDSFDAAVTSARSAGTTGGDERARRYEGWSKKCRDALDAAGRAKAKATEKEKVARGSDGVKPGPAAAGSSTQRRPEPKRTTAATKKSSGSNKPPTMPKYQYYQSDTFVTVSILESGVTEEDLDVKFGLDTLTVILRKQGQSFTVICGTLFDAVDVDKCKVKYMDEKVLIKLRKVEKHEWHELFGSGAQEEVKAKAKGKAKSTSDDPAKGDAGAAAGGGDDSAVPPVSDSPGKSRPYSSHRDWDAIGRDLQRQEDTEKPEGEEALNKLFQDIYGKADEATRRAMVKSFQTSGGTVLSTNWDEVGKTDYEKERQAPKGMEWKNWEGDRLPQKDGD